MRPQLRIAHVSPSYFDKKSVVGGGERYVYNLAHALSAAAPHADAAFEQAIYAIGPSETTFEQGGIPVTILPNDNPETTMTEGFSGRLWTELQRFDLVHVHQSLTVFGAFASIVTKSLGKALVLTDLGSGTNTIMTNGRGIDLADGMISISKYAHDLVAHGFSKRHEVLIGPVDVNLFAPQDLRKIDNLGICVSRIMPHKGIDRIILALPETMTLHVVGQVYDEGYYRILQYISRGRKVKFIHDADDKALVQLLNQASVFMQGSTTKDYYGNIIKNPELMGLSPLEAMAVGLPAIISDVCSFPELVPDASFGRTFSTHEELVGQLRSFVLRDWPGPNAAQKARQHVVDNHSFEIIGRRLGNFYATVCGNR